ncbi:GNAT family N-acetyltransferase [Streptomyces sp. NRRL F-7442]|uniref:GNAT family N-acetyltransferase n=1 Tax=Streptomyces sp. NRRL F-7442 TaxID=1519498 RepID=UPI0006AE54E9|nr:GNAT family N-acetyltransferase [Streptomyces sp. NRRL F-7442]KOX45617.1 streptothricin acetyltransferase [Streptomyces sp. NRRL F-7442]
MTTIEDMDYEFRTARPDDFEAIKALDGSFTTRTVFQVTVTEAGFALREVPVHPPVHKVFPAEDTHDAHTPVAEEDPHSRTFVAVGTDGSLAGFATVSHASWNRRLTVEDIEVAPAHRGRGVGRALIGRAVEFAGECGAGHIWLEVTNINAPAIHAYERMGFTFCGLDTTLYDGTPASGEQALYMSMPCPGRSGSGRI